MFLDSFKRMTPLIGRGVAIKHPDGKVKKHKIKSLKLICDKDGLRINGVELEMTQCELMQFTNRVQMWEKHN